MTAAVDKNSEAGGTQRRCGAGCCLEVSSPEQRAPHTEELLGPSEAYFPGSSREADRAGEWSGLSLLQPQEPPKSSGPELPGGSALCRVAARLHQNGSVTPRKRSGRNPLIIMVCYPVCPGLTPPISSLPISSTSYPAAYTRDRVAFVGVNIWVGDKSVYFHGPGQYCELTASTQPSGCPPLPLRSPGHGLILSLSKQPVPFSHMECSPFGLTSALGRPCLGGGR